MTVTPTSAGAGNANAPSGLFGANGADFNLFLNLLTTQLQNQDPLDPMDTSQYTQQLVQYSQVEQSIQQTGVLRDILSRLSVQDMAQASGLIGREVEFQNAVSGLSDQPAQWSWSAPRAAATMVATVSNERGQVLATQPLTPGLDGRFSWDGQLATGAQAPAGGYTLKIEAKDVNGTAVPVTVRSTGRVQDVIADQGKLAVGVRGITLPLDQVVRVAAPAI